MFQLSTSLLPMNLISTLAIAFGVVYGERSVKERTMFNMLMCALFFVGGWTSFLIGTGMRNNNNDAEFVGIGIPVFALIGQLMMNYCPPQTSSARLGWNIASALLLIAFIMNWVVFVLISSVNGTDMDTFSEEVFGYYITGMGLIVFGMIFYFAMDKERCNMGPSMSVMKQNIYNPSLILLAYGWALVAIANSFEIP